MKEIYIETSPVMEKLAVKENGEFKELYINNKLKESIESNIYRGVVKDIVKSLGSCFVDIGHEKPAFMKLGSNTYMPGDNILVEVTRDPVDEKGAKIKENISIPGRYAVYLPKDDKIKFSRKINDENFKKEMTDYIDSLDIEGAVLFRTESCEVDKDTIKNEIKNLADEYGIIREKFIRSTKPELLKENNRIINYIDRKFDTSSDVLVTNSDRYYDYIKLKMKADKNFNYDNLIYQKFGVFDTNAISGKIEKYIGGRVELESGSNIVIETTEAMTTIDINSSRNVRTKDKSNSAYITNKEVIRAIVDAIVFMDIYGIIVIDFIQMDSDKQKKAIVNELKKAFFRNDSRRVEITDMSKLCLVEIARQSRGFSNIELLKDKIEIMGAPLYVKSKACLLDSIYNEVNRLADMKMIDDDVKSGLVEKKEKIRLEITLNSILTELFVKDRKDFCRGFAGNNAEKRKKEMEKIKNLIKEDLYSVIDFEIFDIDLYLDIVDGDFLVDINL